MIATEPTMTQTISPTKPSRQDTVHSCWLGKSIGGTLGLPAEGKMERLNFSFYDPIPTVAPPNDDLELQLVWLALVEASDGALTQADFARGWIDHIHYMWDEYGRCRWNLRRGVPVECVGTFENPFHAGMGSPIRSEIWACLFPDDPDSTAYYAALDASLDHGMEGIAGEVLFAVMQNRVASGSSLVDAIGLALDYIPANSETADAVNFVIAQHQSGADVWRCWTALCNEHGSQNFTHAPLNVALTIWALWYGDGEFEKSVLLAVNGGYDTDCTAATVGATMGLMLGSEGIPNRWIEPIGEGVFVGPGILGIKAPQSLTELTDRTVAQIGKLHPQAWNPKIWNPSAATPELAALPGTIQLMPADNSHSIPWANGELPIAVKRAGGATWTWHHSSSDPMEIICLARAGARLFLNDQLLIDCPAGLPYVPATHRSPAGSRIRTLVEPGSHQMRLDLLSSDSNQDASVILAYPNLHIAPWTGINLPSAALLPVPKATT